MGSPIPPDPYLALGVPKDATTSAIKTAHRKLVLKCHPDKVTDPAAKQAASHQFHLIQSAYEILVDEDRRGRYNAQVRLAELRREKLENEGSRAARGYDSRPAASSYRTSHDSTLRSAGEPRYSDRYAPQPQYEVRTPPTVATDYFDTQADSTIRRDYRDNDHERAPRRTASHDTKDKGRAYYVREKETVRADRREKERRSERDTRRERDRKYSHVEVESDSDSDESQRRARRRQEDERQRQARDAYYEQSRRQRDEAAGGQYGDDRARKMFSQGFDAGDYISSSRTRQKPDSGRRTSLPRSTSEHDRLQYVRRGERGPALVRQSSSRPQTSSGRDAEPPRRYERRSSDDYDSQPRQHPSLNSSKSSPADIHIPAEKQRSYSLQPDSDAMLDIPQVRRAETMPNRRSDNYVPTRASAQRSTEMHEGMPTPSATPEYDGPSSSTKYQYRKQYADDNFVPTPDGYRPAQAEPYKTAVREPASSTARPAYARKVTRSPSPALREPRESRDAREKSRAASARHEAASRPSLPRHTSTTSTTYRYPSQPATETYDRQRSSAARPSGRRDEKDLYGEIRTTLPENRPATDSPRQAQGPFPLPDAGYRSRDEDYKTRAVRPDSSRMASHYGQQSRRGATSGARPGIGRSASQAIYSRA